MSELSDNHFAVFGLQPVYALDQGALDVRYRGLQRLLHPDRHAGGSDQERRLSVQRAAQVNEAYRVLKDDLARARYLLELAGTPMDDQRTLQQDSAFLMQQMALREAVAEAREAADPGPVLDALGDQLRDGQRALQAQLAEAFAAAADVDSITGLIQRLQFYRKLGSELSELEAELEDAGRL